MTISTILKKLSMVTAGAALLALGFGGTAQATTLTFDELPLQPVDNLTFKGVTFDFKIGGTDSVNAIYGSGGPGNITYVDDPSLEGDTLGILTLDFATAVSALQFGVALNTFNSLAPGFTVELFDSSLKSLGITPVNTAPLVTFSEGLFSYTGAAVKRAVIDFNESSGPRFAFDNLTFEQAESVPEPASALGLLTFSAFGAVSQLKRKQQQKETVKF